ncbi:MAG: hypothetical protein KatS3mg032_0542 [Cyclobacteriaceae bacterium]|nr:MAG: hypothetical protein KatS3mg032_0542 [Cyclobacteriaceae bacterium]
MRIIDEFTQSECRVTLMNWNNRYIIKVEKGLFEQVFKIDQFVLDGEQHLRQLLNDDFMANIDRQFEAMEYALNRALGGLYPSA